MLSNKSLRVLIILAVFSIVGITVTQTYWVRKAFDLHQDQFERDVRSALFSVAQELFVLNKKNFPKKNPVEQVAGNYFIVNIAQEFSVGSLEDLLKSALGKRAIDSDFEYGIYNCDTDQMVYCNYVKHTDVILNQNLNTTLPKSSNQEYYFGVYFPGKYTQIINRMGVWIYSSLVLLLVIVFFSYTMLVILKQRRLSEVQHDFINNMTHEFKTPISTINISAGVIKNPSILKTPQRLLNYATIIQKESDRLQHQIDQILKVATIDHTVKHLNKTPFDVNQLIIDAVEAFDVLLKENGGKFEMSLKTSNSVLMADKLHITNMIHNLIDNAIKYCTQVPHIIVSTTETDGYLVMTVSDNGIGISSEEQKKVFNKLYRVSTGNQHDVKGFGLGLYYVKYIVDAHDGKINLTSDQNGSAFQIKIPIVSN